MSYILDNFNTDDDNFKILFGTGVTKRVWAETFLADRNSLVSGVKLKLYKKGTIGNVTVSLVKASDVYGTAMLPTGPELATKTFSGDGFTTNTAGQWEEVTFDPQVQIIQDSYYSILVSLEGGDGVYNYLALRIKTMGGPAVVTGYLSTDNGSSWNSQVSDALFELQGTHSGPIMVEQYISSGGGGSIFDIYGARWFNQTFTVLNKSYPIWGVRLPIYRVGNPGNVTVSIQATTGSPPHPDGTDLCSVIFDGNVLLTSVIQNTWQWHPMLVFTTHPTLTVGQSYAIVVKSAGVNTSNTAVLNRGSYITYRYGGGASGTSTNSGVTWIQSTTSCVVYGFQLFTTDTGYSKGENFAGSANISDIITTENFFGQSITPSNPFQLISCRFLLRSTTGGSTNKVTGYLSLADINGLPTGAPLSTFERYDTTLTLVNQGNLDIEHASEFFLPTPIDLVAGTKYTTHFSRGGTDQDITMMAETTANSTYAGGNLISKLGAGAWTNVTPAHDNIFELWGYELPYVIDQSSDTEVWLNGSVDLFVEAGGTEPLTYQWYKDNNLLPGETDVDLIIASASITNAGTYKCIITSAYGTATSADIILTVDSITSQTASPYNVLVSADITMGVVVAGTNLQFQWYKDDSLLSGEVNDSITFFAQLTDSGTYKCEISNIHGFEWSADIILSVSPRSSVRFRNIFNLPIDLDREI